MFEALYIPSDKYLFADDAFDKIPEIKDKKSNERKNFVCCKDCNKPVRPVKEHVRIYNKETKIKTVVMPHFRFLNSDTHCILESDEHKEMKANLKILLINNNHNFEYRKEIIQLPRYLVSCEKPHENRRADVLLKFNKYSSFLGNGIVLEVAVSEKEKSLEEKAIDWIGYGFSVCKIREINNPIKISYPFGLFQDIVKNPYLLKKFFYRRC